MNNNIEVNKLDNFKIVITLLLVAILCFLFYNNKHQIEYDIASPRLLKTLNFEASGAFIQNNSIEIETKNTDKTRNSIEGLIKNYNGLVESINSDQVSNKNIYNMIFRIPSEKISEFLKILKKEYTVVSENFSEINIQDSYKDKENKLKNLNLRKEKLENLLIKSSSVQDVLSINKELINIQNQIDFLQENKNKLEKDIKLTMVNLTIKPKNITNFGNSWNLKKSLFQAINNFNIFTQKLCNLLINIFIFSPYIAIFFVITKFTINKFIK